jgi:hypothetical protein
MEERGGGVREKEFDICSNFSYIGLCAGVVKLVDARDSKSRGASTPCRFDSDLRHQLSVIPNHSVFSEKVLPRVGELVLKK